MSLLFRLRRKIADVRRYPPLAWRTADRRALWALGLFRCRVLSAAAATGLFSSGRRVLTPRLAATHGLPARIDLDHPGQIDTFDEIFVDRVYNLGTVQFQPDLVVDCGGYCGYFSTMACGAFPQARIHCFEANPENLPMIEHQFALLDGRAQLHPAAVYIRDGTISFAGDGVGGSVTEQGTAPNSHLIPCIDFAAWLRSRAPRRLVWKLDVEGAERELLPAALPWLPKETVCFLETHHPDAVCRALFQPYRDAGFTITEIRRRSAAPQPFDYVEWELIRRP